MAEITCPSCQRRLYAPAGSGGLQVQCAACRHTFTAPPLPAEPPPPSADDELDAPERFRRPPPPRALQLGRLLAFLAALAALAWLALRSF